MSGKELADAMLWDERRRFLFALFFWLDYLYRALFYTILPLSRKIFVYFGWDIGYQISGIITLSLSCENY